MNNKIIPPEKDKRKYFRIDDVALLSYRVVSWDEVRSAQKLDHSLPITKHTLKANLDRLSRELQPLYNVIKPSSPNIANYLATLDKKINLLGEYLIKDNETETDMKLYHINIGAGGFSFISDKYILDGATLELQLKLLPEGITIYSYARVISCSQQNDSSEQQTYKSAVEFEFMEDDVRDMISRHVLNKERALINKA